MPESLPKLLPKPLSGAFPSAISSICGIGSEAAYAQDKEKYLLDDTNLEPTGPGWQFDSKLLTGVELA